MLSYLSEFFFKIRFLINHGSDSDRVKALGWKNTLQLNQSLSEGDLEALEEVYQSRGEIINLTISDAKKAAESSCGQLGSHLLGKGKTVKGHTFRYVNGDE